MKKAIRFLGVFLQYYYHETFILFDLLPLAYCHFLYNAYFHKSIKCQHFNGNQVFCDEDNINFISMFILPFFDLLSVYICWIILLPIMTSYSRLLTLHCVIIILATENNNNKKLIRETTHAGSLPCHFLSLLWYGHETHAHLNLRDGSLENIQWFGG